MQYFFILGKNPILSKAEIEAVLELKGLKIENSELYNKVYFIEMEDKLDIEWLNSRLGGTVKIGKVLDKMNDLEDFDQKFFKLVKFGKGKVYFGFSLYPLSREIHLQQYQKELNSVAMDIKDILREKYHINSRYVVSREAELSSVIVAKNKLLKNGAEICFFIKDNEIQIGQTLAVQQFEEFGARDYSRPGRDQVSGMLPPKLARMMINLAQLEQNKTILDPFCGSGTVLQEALVLGYKKLIGSDNSDKAIEDTRKNLEWLLAKSEARRPKYEVFKLEVRDLAKEFKGNSIDAIITEPYLGPALRGNESQEQINKTINELENLYLIAFEQFTKVLVKNGKVVMIFPVFNLRNSLFKLNILNQIEKLGYKKLNKQDLVYYREKQYVWREIEIFEKVKI
jgi:tRNA G10  N-methylase Trm11